MELLFNAKDPETGSPLSETEIIAESISSIVGVSDTTSSTMTSVVDFVSRLPETQEQVAVELDNAYPGHTPSGWVADFLAVNQLPVLNAVVGERCD